MENVDSIKESNSGEDGPLNKDQIEVDSSKEPSTSVSYTHLTLPTILLV